MGSFDLGAALLQGLWAFIATIGFAILFNVPPRVLLACGLIGGFGHMMRFVLREVGISNEVATYIGALIVGLVGYWTAVAYHWPRLVFTVTGIISMVPGVPAYEVLVFFSQGDIQGGLQNAVRVALVTGAIGAGLGTARILTEVEWRRNGESRPT